MRFKITLKDKTVIYVNDICIFGGPDDYRLSLWHRTEIHLEIGRFISMDKISTILDMGMLIYC